VIYGGVISTPANTAEASPQDTEVSVAEGIVYHLKVIFPPGPSGLLRVQILDATYLMFPTTLGQSFRGDNLRLDFDVMYAKTAAPFLFIIRTWNLDDTYDHEVQVSLCMESAEEYKARYLPSAQTNPLIMALAEQEAMKTVARRARVDAFLGKLGGEGESNGTDQTP